MLRIFILSLLLSGCAQSINWNDPAAITSKIEVKHDEFKKVTSFNGPNCAKDASADTVVLRAWKMQSGAMAYQIYIDDEYTYEILRGGRGWRFYSAAHDSDGNSLQASSISRTVNWCGRNVCSYREIIGLDIAREYLEERKERGLIVKISGTGGEEIIVIPAAYLQAFLATAN